MKKKLGQNIPELWNQAGRHATHRECMPIGGYRCGMAQGLYPQAFP